MKIYVSHSSAFDYVNELYTPLEQSDLTNNHSFFLPHKKENLPMKPNSNISNYDLILAEVSYPSTGQGIEIGYANCLDKPIVCVYIQGYKISSAIKVTTNYLIEYSNAADMINKIEALLNQLKK